MSQRQPQRRARASISSYCLATALAAGACSAPHPPEALPLAQRGKDADGFASSAGDLAGEASQAARALDPGPGCLGETRAAEAIGLDMFLMLDVSGSMLDPLPASPLARGTSKWDAVRSSLESFVQAPETTEIGIGLQYFPQSNAGVSFACTSNAECGASGACTSTLCVTNGQVELGSDPPLEFIRIAGEQGTLCSTDADCSGTDESCRTLLGACVFPPGAVAERSEAHFANVSASPQTSFVSARCSVQEDCQGVPRSRCEVVRLCSLAPVQCSPSVACGPGAGECLSFPYTCSNYTSCDAARYADPAVAISRSTTRSADVIASLRAQVPVGATPTGPALRGALEQARRWGEQHPERQVVTVLATDGFPTMCEPLEIPDLAQLTRAASSANLPVRTFVIGVFSGEDLDTEGRRRLDEIASAGGSEHALVVNAAANVSEEFLAALSQIRSTAVSCDFQLDSAARLDFDRVNLRISDKTGATRELLNVGDGSACGAADGWYYLKDGAGIPVQLSVCPAVCAELSSGRLSAELQIGCATRIR
ncbi:MAG: hypothetical protein ABI895_25105 [Deltaproteobacteria bacterium]